MATETDIRNEIERGLLPKEVHEAFRGDVACGALAQFLANALSGSLIDAKLSVDGVRVLGVKLDFLSEEEEEELDPEDEDERGCVTVYAELVLVGEAFRAWGEFHFEEGEFRGSFNPPEREASKTPPPKLAWSEVFERTGVRTTFALVRYVEKIEENAVRRGVESGRCLHERELFVRPDQLPLLRMPAGDNLCLRFHPKSGEVLDYAMVVHDEVLTVPMGNDLAAAVKSCGVDVGDELGASWEAVAAEIANGPIEGFDELAADLKLESDWRWKLRVQEGLQSLSEEACREWLDTCAGRTGQAFVKNSRYLTNTAFAAARLGDKERAVEAAVGALRLPARDGDADRHALRLLDELGADVPAELKTLCDCVRSSDNDGAVQTALVEAAKTRTESGDHEGGYDLLMRACYDVGAMETPELLQRLLEAARAAEYEPVAKVLAARLEHGAP